MAGGSRAVVGDFTFDSDVAVLLLDELADLGDEITDRPDAAATTRLSKIKAELGRERVGEWGSEWVFGRHSFAV